MSEPRNFIKITSPEGVLNYPQSLQKPNTKFDPEGVWQADLILSPEEGLAFKDKIQEIWDEQIKDSVIDYNNLQKKKVKTKDFPIEEDDETGNIVIKLKMKTKTSAGKAQRPIIVDSKGKPLFDVSLASGTKALVGIQLYGWYSPALGMGLRFEPKAVSVTELKEYQADSGFDFAIDKVMQAEEEESILKEFNDGKDSQEDDEEDF